MRLPASRTRLNQSQCETSRPARTPNGPPGHGRCSLSKLNMCRRKQHLATLGPEELAGRGLGKLQLRGLMTSRFCRGFNFTAAVAHCATLGDKITFYLSSSTWLSLTDLFSLPAGETQTQLQVLFCCLIAFCKPELTQCELYLKAFALKRKKNDPHLKRLSSPVMVRRQHACSMVVNFTLETLKKEN